MKPLLILALLALPACHAGGFIDRIAPQTAAGFRANGIVGGLDGLSGAVIALCERADGERFRVAVDALASEIGTVSSVEAIREKRAKACAVAGGARLVAEAAAGEG